MEQKNEDRAALPAAALTGEAVAAYLRQHPDFLYEHPEVARVLTPPTHANGDDVVDFNRFLIDRLRAEISALKARETSLITTVESNASGQGRVHRAVIKMLDARDPVEFLRVIQVDLLAILDVAAATLCTDTKVSDALFDGDREAMVMDSGDLARLIQPGRDTALRPAGPDDQALFTDSGDKVASVALLRLVLARGEPSGILALGSGKADGFHPNQGTDLLVFLARVAEARLRLWLMTSR